MFDFACFPLVPYVNRIAHGRFVWEGEEHRLAPNYAGQAHPLHGLGWLAPWSVLTSDDTAVTMELLHAGDAVWPWPFHSVQTFSLSGSGLRGTLSLRNEGDSPVPWALGFHPYFAKSRGDRFTFSASGVWLADAEMLPVAHAAADALGDWSKAAPLTRTGLVDHCYTGWDGTARIARSDGDLVLTGANTPNLHLYVPPNADFFCAEPMTAMPDAVNRPATPIIGPGECRTIEMSIAMVG